MDKIAIDIALLPSIEVIEKSIEINKILKGKNNREIILSKEDCLPHISLAMGCISKEDIPKIKEELMNITCKFKALKLKIPFIYSNEWQNGNLGTSMEVKSTANLQRLHLEIMNAISKISKFDPIKEMFFNPDEINDMTLDWTKRYSETSAFGKFHPHITLGIGEAEPLDKEINFISSKVAICQLGNNCTCRKVIYTLDLGG